MEPNDEKCPHVVIWLATLVFSTILNLAIILFIVFSYVNTAPSNAATNVASIITLIIYYIGLAVHFGLFMYSSGLWEKLNQYIFGMFVALCLIVGFPLFYIASLPFSVFYFICWIGTPCELWNRMFCNGCYSLNSFTNARRNAGITILMGIYIGIPFAIFCILYFAFVILLLPIIFILFAPYGFGTFGCCLHLWTLRKCQCAEVLYQYMNKTFVYCMFPCVYGIALPMIIISIVYIVAISASWFAIFLLVASAVYFLAFIYFTFGAFIFKNARQLV